MNLSNVSRDVPSFVQIVYKKVGSGGAELELEVALLVFVVVSVVLVISSILVGVTSATLLVVTITPAFLLSKSWSR